MSSKHLKKKNMFLVCVYKGPAPCGQEGLVFHECSTIGMYVKLSQFPSFHCCDQIVCFR